MPSLSLGVHTWVWISAFRAHDRLVMQRETWRVQDVGCRMCHCQWDLLPYRHCLYLRLRAPRRKGRPVMIETALLCLVTIGLIVYLVYALLQPEKF